MLRIPSTTEILSAPGGGITLSHPAYEAGWNITRQPNYSVRLLVHLL